MDPTDLINAVVDREGGFVDHPADPGGPTRWGITQATARANGYGGDMRTLSREQAGAIYRRVYWLRPGFWQIAQHTPVLAGELFDTGVNMGPPVAIAFLQRALNALNRGAADYPDIVVDGTIGPVTVAALAAFMTTRGKRGETVLLKAVEALQGERYVSLAERRPAAEAFLYGWLANRIG